MKKRLKTLHFRSDGHLQVLWCRSESLRKRGWVLLIQDQLLWHVISATRSPRLKTQVTEETPQLPPHCNGKFCTIITVVTWLHFLQQLTAAAQAKRWKHADEEKNTPLMRHCVGVSGSLQNQALVRKLEGFKSRLTVRKSLKLLNSRSLSALKRSWAR